MTRQELVSLVAIALDNENPNIVYTAISCVRKMTSDERKQLEAKLNALAKHPDKSIRIEALGALNDHNTQRKRGAYGEYFIRLPNMGALVPAVRRGKPALRAV